ncbi:hypothetical protein BRADI_5g03267v3, partial [Brachypodium distachyon]
MQEQLITFLMSINFCKKYISGDTDLSPQSSFVQDFPFDTKFMLLLVGHHCFFDLESMGSIVESSVQYSWKLTDLIFYQQRGKPFNEYTIIIRCACLYNECISMCSVDTLAVYFILGMSSQ